MPRRELCILELIKQIHRFAVAVPADYNVSDVVDNAAQFEACWLTRVMLVLEELTVRHEIPSITDHKHITDVRVSETSGNHPRVHAREEDSFRLGIVSDLLEFANHLSSGCVPVSHNAS